MNAQRPAPIQPRVPRRVAATLINSLKGGVVPRMGLPYITVGRTREIQALLHDLDLVAEGGAAFRFLVGRYGSGKSFLLQTMRNHAMGNGFAVCDADLSPERRLQGTRGQGLATYRELMRNLSTKTCPDGGALPLVFDRWLSNLRADVAAEGVSEASPAFDQAVETRIYQIVRQVEELVHGYDFAKLLVRYHQAWQQGDAKAQANVVKWFRGEYRTKTEARAELGVSVIITDDSWYDYLKLFACFLKGAGYAGLLVLIDELVNLYKIPNAVTRQYNYEKILTMYNDTLQGRARYLNIIIGGTPQSIEDQRRGLFSYEALRSRLTQGRFAGAGYADMLAPLIRLEPLTNEELLVLAEKLADIHAGLFGYQRSLNQDDLVCFLQKEYDRVGTQTHLTPREVIRDFIELLDILYQNPDASFECILQADTARLDKESTGSSFAVSTAHPALTSQPSADAGAAPNPQPAAYAAPPRAQRTQGESQFAEFTI